MKDADQLDEPVTGLQRAVALLRDSSNTFRSFFGTNILTMAWTFSNLGAVLGPSVTFFCGFVVYRATCSLIRVKQSLPNHESVVSYGAVVFAVASWPGQLAVDILVGFTQFMTCISYTAFSSKNLHRLAPQIPFGYCILLLATVAGIISCFHHPLMLAKVSIFTNLMMMTGISVILTTTTFADATDVPLALPEGLPIGIATLSASLGGITTVLDVERTMTGTPGRYMWLLRRVLPFAVVLLSTVGLMGFLTFGMKTCAVLSLSLRKGSWQELAASSVLTAGPCFESVLNSFPLFILTERWSTNIPPAALLAHRFPLVFKCAHRVITFALIGSIAYGMPFIGDIAAINGAIGYASLSFLVPIICEVLRARRHDVIVAGNGNAEVDHGVHHEKSEESSLLAGGIQRAPLPLPSPAAPYTLSFQRKVELLLIFVFGFFVVVVGAVFAIINIVHSESRPTPNHLSNGTTPVC
jgi:hypothetical protein